MRRALLAAIAILLPLAAPAQAKEKAKHTDADYADGRLEQWNKESWGPNVYHDRQAEITCYASDLPHEMPDCEKDIPEWQVRIADDYYQVGWGDTTNLSLDEFAPRIDPIKDAESSCRSVAAESNPIWRETITQEGERENSTKKGQLMYAECATKIRCRLVLGKATILTLRDRTRVKTVSATLYVPLYDKKGQVVGEARYNVVQSPYPRLHPADFLDLWTTAARL